MEFLTKHSKFVAYFIFNLMLVFDTKEALKAHLNSIRTPNHRVGFVPTMGALHDGHLSLLRNALLDNSIAVVSIFVNPTQFNNPEDLVNYPRTVASDLKKIASISDAVIVYTPSEADIYEGNTQSTAFSFDGLENQMEGKFRPGHFDGVGTVVKKLFEIMEPQTAYFGEKDFQQLQIIKKLVEKEKLPIAIVGCPIYREKNGLAMSSRNERLDPITREKASCIYAALLKVKTLFTTQSIPELKAIIEADFSAQSIFQLEYLEIAEESTLESARSKIAGQSYRAFIAVIVNNVRLIDTISLN